MKNEIISQKSYANAIEITVRGEEDYVRSEVARMLGDTALKYGYGILCTTKPQLDTTRNDGSWVAVLRRSQSCD